MKTTILLGVAILLTVGLTACAAEPTPTPVPEPVLTGTPGTRPWTPTPGPTATATLVLTPTVEPEPGFGDGTHVVGEDIEPGIYRSTGTAMCYWARLSGFGGELGDIIANGNKAPEIVTVGSGDAGFETRGCGEWVPVEEIAPESPATVFGDGTYEVGVHIEPGTYRSTGTAMCYWARLSGFGGELGDIIANGNEPTVIEIREADAGFTTFGCGTWSKRK